METDKHHNTQHKERKEILKMIKCTDCPYFWSDLDKDGKPITRPHCHYQYNDGYAPCEVEDNETKDIYED